MRRIAIINQKGGVGKTTTAVNLAAALAEAGQRVCVIDLDPQAHATTHLGIEPDGKAASMYDVLNDLQGFLDKGRGGTAPWAKARIFRTRIRRNIKLAECPSFGQSIFAYAPTCNGATDYIALAQEVLGAGPTILSARLELEEETIKPLEV